MRLQAQEWISSIVIAQQETAPIRRFIFVPLTMPSPSRSWDNSLLIEAHFVVAYLLVCIGGTVMAQTLTVKSTAFDNGGVIPMEYTGEGRDISPPLAWS